MDNIEQLKQKFGFKENPGYYLYENGKLYQVSRNGTKHQTMRCMRKLDNYKIFSEHFNCALPFSNYVVVDLQNNKLYYLHDYTIWYGSPINEFIEILKQE